MRFSIFLLLILPNFLIGQSEVPLTLRAQFNGPYGYTIIGNTHNEFDNWQSPSPPCQMLTQSSASLNLNGNQNIIAAFLYWSGVGDGTFNPTVTLNGINYTADQTVVGFPSSFNEFSFFGSFKDVTNQVQLTGNGNYIFSNLDLNPIIGLYCSNAVYFSGWYIIVIYEESGIDNKQLNIYDGYNVVYEYFEGGVTSFNIDNLNVVETTNAQLSYVAWNGSTNLFSNESITINGSPLSNAFNPINNPFNSTNNFNGSSSLWNMDIDNFEINNFINVSDTNASITLTSEYFRFLQSLVTSIRSELPDATVTIDQVTGQEVCGNRNLLVECTVFNINSNAVLPEVPVAFYADDTLLFIQNTVLPLAIGESVTFFTSLFIPESIPNPFTLRVVVNDNGFPGLGGIPESNVNNNESIEVITLLLDTIPSVFSLATSFCQNNTVPPLPLVSDNGISGTWSPSVISNQGSGSYVFTPNAGQCSASFTLDVTITPVTVPTFSVATTFCQNALVPALPLVSDNGISGSWSPSVISNQSSGSYVFTPNAGQCADSFSFNVTITPVTVPTFSIANTYCQNASVPDLPLVSDNGISGSWLPSVISNQSSGSYVFTPNADQCADSFSLNVTITPVTVPTFSIANTYCQNASVSDLPLVSDNGISGSWSPSVISNQSSGSYLFTPTAGQCADSFSLNVTITPITAPTFSFAASFCQNATVPPLPLVSDNGISGTWSPSVISNQGSGSYVFTPNAGQCSASFTLDVTITPVTVPTFSVATTFCQNALVPALPLVSDNGISGTWSPSVISNQVSGSYVFTPNADQCADSFSLNVTITPVTVPTFSIANTYCQNASVPDLQLVSDNGISGSWSPSVISNQSSGSYVFTPNADQCADSFSLNVTITPVTVPTFSIANTYCQNASVPDLQLVSDNGISGSWSPSVISNQSSGSYVFTPNADQCADSFSLNVTITPVTVPTFSIANTYCQNASVPDLPLVSDNGISGSWSPSVISNQGSGSYVFTPNAGQCSDSFTLNVTITPSGSLSQDVFLCDTPSGIRSEVLATSLSLQTHSFEWFFMNQLLPDTDSSLTINTPGMYQAIATSILTGCTLVYQFDVFVLPPVSVQINTSPDFSTHPFVDVIASGGSGSFLYSFNQGPFQNQPSFNPLDALDVLVQVIDTQGCYSEQFLLNLLQYPAFFTPNGDGFNDRWGIQSSLEMRIDIFDRYGKLLYVMKNNETWDGVHKGKPLPSTDYWFVVYYDQKTFQGHFSLKR